MKKIVFKDKVPGFVDQITGGDFKGKVSANLVVGDQFERFDMDNKTPKIFEIVDKQQKDGYTITYSKVVG